MAEGYRRRGNGDGQKRSRAAARAEHPEMCLLSVHKNARMVHKYARGVNTVDAAGDEVTV
jgi:hypothetical protein